MSDGPLIVIFVILKLWVVKFCITKFCQCANIIFDKKNQSQGGDGRGWGEKKYTDVFKSRGNILGQSASKH